MYRRFAEVIVPVSLPLLYTYEIPGIFLSKCVEGARVAVPFGKSKIYSAIVRRITETCPQDCEIKEILEVLDTVPIVNAIQFQFWDWIASYYMCSLGEVCRAALPSSLKLESATVLYRTAKPTDFNELKPKEAMLLAAFDNGKINELELSKATKYTGLKNNISIIKNLIGMGYLVADKVIEDKYKPKTAKFIALADSIQDESQLRDTLNALAQKSPKQFETMMTFVKMAHDTITDGIISTRNEIERKALLQNPRVTQSALLALISKSLLTETQREVSRIAAYDGEIELSHDLTEHQKVAYDEILKQFETKNTVLLHGVTGSGKTEIYIKLIEECINQGKQVLYLLPEIILSSQIIRRLQKVFGDEVGIYHSKISDAERAEMWHRLCSPDTNSYKLIVGVRSSIFLPFSNIGLIIVDEEHDASYKQQDPAPRYNARDCAIVLATMHNAKTLLGSATPSIDSYFNAKTAKYGLVELLKRYSTASLPEITVIDTLEAARTSSMQSIFATSLISEISNTIKHGQQAMIFRNRRGFSPYVECQACGWVPTCENCDVSLTYHKHENRLVCHHCGFVMDMPCQCKACGDKTLTAKGYGTEKIEDEIKIFFPDARISRLDADVTTSRQRYEQIIYEFENGMTDIIAGTQMISKGFDFRNLHLAGVLGTDMMLNFPDFRAEERAYQLLTQVSGRAGRSSIRGKVMIQTSQPKNPVINDVINGDYHKFYERTIAERSQYAYPPFTRLIRIQLKHKENHFLDDCAEKLAKMLRQVFGAGVMGPEYPVLPRIQNMYIKEILLKISKNHYGIQAKSSILAAIGNLRAGIAKGGLMININVDPQ
ncbi:MAG: primosomal protein N' [Bacteroidales bacterium]|nr:primosomal protein N' [Bacteroidales bacterium]